MVQLVGVVERHFETYTLLQDKTVLVKSKATRSYTVLEELSNRIEVPEIRSVLFAHALKD